MTPLALALFLCAAADKPVVSVLYFENLTGDARFDVMRKGLADMMVTDLVSWDGVTVVERERLEAVLGELKLQQTKAFDAETVVKVGRLLGAQYLVTGSMLSTDPMSIEVDAKLVRVEKGDVVATARIADQRDRIFDLEQRLVERLTEQIDLKVSHKPARRKAFVPNMSVLMSYANGLDLADQGKLDDANKLIAQLVSKNPLVTMARDTQVALLKRLEASKSRAADISSASAGELGRRLDRALPLLTADTLEVRSKRVAWLLVRSVLLQRALIAQCSQRDQDTHFMLPGREPAGVRTLRELYENDLRVFDEVAADERLDPRLDDDPGLVVLLKDAHLGNDGRFSTNMTSMLDRLGNLLVLGRTSEKGERVYPTLAALDPKRVDAFFLRLEKITTATRARYDATPPERRGVLEHELAQVLSQKAEVLEKLERDEDAALAWQKLLDDFPTRNNSFAERRIKIIAGVEHDHSRDQRERWREGLRTCDDMDLRVGSGVMGRYERLGLAGIDAFAAEVEKPCLGRPGMDSTWDFIYRSLASLAATHDDCARARTYFLKQFTWGVGPRSLEHPNKSYPWCDFKFAEETLPTKVHVNEVGGARDPLLRAALRALEDLLTEELGARGIPIETGGSSHGGVGAVTISVDGGGLRLRFSMFDNSPPVESTTSLPFEALDVNAALAPLLKAMRPGTEVGPKKRAAKLPFDLLVAYGQALELKPRESQKAFEALAMKYPQFRLVRTRADMAAARSEGQ